jgi:hypothetical protein
VSTNSVQNKVEALLLCSICFLPFFRGIRFVTFLSLQDVLILCTITWILLTKYAFYKEYLFAIGLAVFITGILILQTFIVSDNTFNSTVNILKCLNCYLFLPLVLLYLTRLKDSYHLGVTSYVIGAVFSSLITMFGISESSKSISRISGFAGDPVMYSILLSFALCYLISNDPSVLKKSLTLRLLAVSLISIEILRTGSGSGLAITVLGVFFARVLLRGGGTRKASSIMDFGIVVVLWFVWNSDYANTTKERMQVILNPQAGYSHSTNSGGSTIESRVLSIKYAIELIQEQPILGSGFSFNSQLTDLGIQPHNYFILAWLTGGVLFLSCTLVFFFWNLRQSLVSYQKRDSIVMITQVGVFFALMTNPILWDGGFFTALLIILLKERRLLPNNLATEKLH